MKLRTRLLIAAVVIGMGISSLASAHPYDRDDSDYPLRYMAYPLHALGMAIEYGFLRPIHWFVSHETPGIIFGHETGPREEPYFEWK